jgi:hypothetical protein
MKHPEVLGANYASDADAGGRATLGELAASALRRPVSTSCKMGGIKTGFRNDSLHTTQNQFSVPLILFLPRARDSKERTSAGSYLKGSLVIREGFIRERRVKRGLFREFLRRLRKVGYFLIKK